MADMSFKRARERYVLRWQLIRWSSGLFLAAALIGMEVARARYRWEPLDERDRQELKSLSPEVFQTARTQITTALLGKEKGGFSPRAGVAQVVEELPPTLFTLSYREALPYRAVMADLGTLATVCEGENTNLWHQVLVAYCAEKGRVEIQSETVKEPDSLEKRVARYQESYVMRQKQREAFWKRLRERANQKQK